MQRRLLAWLGCAFGVAWLLRRLRARPEHAAPDPADELRQKLQEAREEAVVAPEPPSEEPAGAEPEPEPEAPLEDRRRAVHERGRAAIDHMRGTDSTAGER
jgi:hypothetical protein